MSKPILYGVIGSPPVRAVLLTLYALDLEYELKEVNPQLGENRTKEFVEMNPQHTIPLLEDDGHYVWDSHSIIAYLVRKFGKTDALYPKDFCLRAVVDQLLHFDSGVLSGSVRNAFMTPTLTKEQKIAVFKEAYGFLEAFIKTPYLSGEHLTIADFSILSTVTSFGAIVPIDAEKTPRLTAWLALMQTLPYYEEANGKGLRLTIELVNQLLASGAF